VMPFICSRSSSWKVFMWGMRWSHSFNMLWKTHCKGQEVPWPNSQ
jgi:hypothetical protein